MGDLVRALTEAWDKVGGQAVMTIVIIVAAGYTIHWNRRLVDALTASKDSLAFTQRDTITRNTAAMENNTGSNATLQKAIDKLCVAMGSDPRKLCQYSVTFNSLKQAMKESGMPDMDDKTIERALAMQGIKKPV